MTQQSFAFTRMLPPQARKDDPVTSHLAVEAITASGRRSSLKKRCFQAIKDNPHGLTPGEVSEALGLPHEKVWRRTSELVKDGQVFRDGVRKWRGSDQGVLKVTP